MLIGSTIVQMQSSLRERNRNNDLEDPAKSIKMSNSEFYNSSQTYLSILEQRNEHDYETILGAIRSYARGGNALDYGCGVGLLSMLMSKEGYVATGVDISQQFIQTAKTKFDTSPTLTFEVIDGLPLRYADGAFDVIATSAVLEHCTRVDGILLEFKRLLKTNGLLFIETPNMLSPLAQMKLMVQRITGRRKKLHRYATPLFFCFGLYHLIRKMLSRKAKFVYVEPNYETFAEADEDVTYLSNPLDYLFFLRSVGFDVLELSRNSGFVRTFISKHLPSIAGGVMIVARKK
jgi:2-polyprenyl-3-methyl-5-hydroxy-6-metoxy-1,4-benzoquinol methylase